MSISWTNKKMNNGPKILLKYNNILLLLIGFRFSIQVKDVIVRLDDLIAQIKSDQQSRVKLEEPLSIDIYTD